MATKVGIRQLRDTLTATIKRVQRGETVEVTNHGVTVAVLSPAPSRHVDRLVAAGDVVPGIPLERPIKRRSVTGASSASRALEDDRAER